MFCSRPFRHKSGLNSHHKRHIQNGIFDRPISCKDPAKLVKKKRIIIMKSAATANAVIGGGEASLNTTLASMIVEDVGGDGEGSMPQNNRLPSPAIVSGVGGTSTTKSKRKGRPPRRKEAVPQPDVSMYQIDPGMYRVKEEEDEPDNDYMLPTSNRETVTFDVQDVFECNFCGLTFPMRTAYLKHVNTVHRATPQFASVPPGSEPGGSNSSDGGNTSDRNRGLMMMDGVGDSSSSPGALGASGGLSQYIDQMDDSFENMLDTPTTHLDDEGGNQEVGGGTLSPDTIVVRQSSPQPPSSSSGDVGLIPAHRIKEEKPDY